MVSGFSKHQNIMTAKKLSNTFDGDKFRGLNPPKMGFYALWILFAEVYFIKGVFSQIANEVCY